MGQYLSHMTTSQTKAPVHVTIYHDRFLIIDDQVYFMGASLKDMGAGLCAVTEMQILPETLLNYLK